MLLAVASGRLFALYQPGNNEFFSLRAGLGGGSLRSDLGFLTIDGSAILSVPLFQDVFEPYAGFHLAYCHPFGGYLKNHPYVTDPEDCDFLCTATTGGFVDTGWVGGSVGFLIHFSKRVAWSLDYSIMAGTPDGGYISLTSGIKVDL